MSTNGNEELLVFNGVNGSTGDYLLPPMDAQRLSKLAQGEQFDPAELDELNWRYQQRTQGGQYGTMAGVDNTDLSSAGWGVIFAHGADPAIREALTELLEHRKSQANAKKELYKELTYRPKESKNDFLSRQGAGPGPVDPTIVPYYLLIVGDPDTIPYTFQYQLDVQYAVGRIHFDTPQEYARYAHSVVLAESGKLALPRRAAFFGVQNPGDKATELSSSYLVGPMAQYVQENFSDWSVNQVVKEAATKARLGQLLGGSETPALLFTASHGMGFNLDDPQQLAHQGALLCQDWPGPQQWRQPIPQDHYFSADDVSSEARLLGSIVFHFACYGAGTPQFDDYAQAAPGNRQRASIAPRAFVANLPRKLLGHPAGGALAVIGHVERAWGTSFLWEKAGKQLAVFQNAVKMLLDGHMVGEAMEAFNERYAELSVGLTSDLEEIKWGTPPNDLKLANMWTANNDARGYAIIGDPAARLVTSGTAPVQRLTIETVTVRSSTVTVTAPAPVTAAPPATTAATPAPVLSAAPESGSYEKRPAATGEEVTSYGLFDPLNGVKERLTGALSDFAEKLGQTLKNMIDDASSLEVATYVSEDMGNVVYNRENGQFSGSARLRALTHIKLDGDTLVCVPETASGIDSELWNLHSAMVQQAQQHRAELLKAAAAAATGLLGALKSL